MLIQLALTEQIINECLKLHYTEQLAARRLKQRLILIPLALVAISCYLIYSELKRDTPGQNLYMAFLYIAFAISYYFFMRYRTIKGGRQLLKTLGNNATFSMQVFDDKLTTTTQAGTFDTTWESFTHAVISSQIVLLYQSDNSFSMFYHAFFQSDNFERFKLLVKQKVALVREI